MPPAIDATLSALEASTQRLLAADPEDFPAIASALEQRSEALARLPDAWDNSMLAEMPGIGERLRRVLDGGAEVSRKLRLVRAAAQAELARTCRTRLTQEAFMLAALLAPVRQARIDFFG